MLFRTDLEFGGIRVDLAFWEMVSTAPRRYVLSGLWCLLDVLYHFRLPQARVLATARAACHGCNCGWRLPGKTLFAHERHLVRCDPAAPRRHEHFSRGG